LVIHTRQASEDTLAILKEEGEDGSAGSAGGVFHCFTESTEVAKAALDLGFFISFSGILTFKSAKELRDVARLIPDDRLLIETDSPYLAPVPHRGKTNSPAWVAHVAHTLAEVRGQAIEDVAQHTSQNFERLFSGVRS
jgi:TatD DNase family protein